MLGIKLTDKSIETLFTRLLSALSGNSNYIDIFNNEIKEVYDLFKVIHKNYLEAFTELRYVTLVEEGGESMVLQSIERIRIENEAERRMLVAKVDSFIRDFPPAKIRNCDPIYVFFIKAKTYFISLNNCFNDSTEDLKKKFKDERALLAADQFMIDHPGSPHPLFNTGFSSAAEFAKYVQKIPDVGVRIAVLGKVLESSLESMRKSWDGLCQSYVVLEKRFKELNRNGQL